MDVNYYAVAVCGVLAMVVGYVWYGPLFGKTWARVIGADIEDMEARKKMQQSAGPLYGVQFALSLFQAYVLAHFINGWTDAPGIETSLWIFAGFVIPLAAAASMWNNDSRKVAWTRFLLMAGYQLVLFVAFGLILGYWK